MVEDVSGEEAGNVVSRPSDDALEAAFAPYTTAVGRVAHSWNYLHEALGQLFVVVMGADRSRALAVWYSSKSDLAQRDMLRAAVEAAPDDLWPPNQPEARSDVIWLLAKCTSLSHQRNDAIHAPCSLAIDRKRLVVMPTYFYGNPKAKSLMGKDILLEFEWYERYAGALTVFVRQIETALGWPDRYPWPRRPLLPTHGQKNAPADRPRQSPQE